VVVAPAAIDRVQERLDGVLVAGGVALWLAAGAYAGIRLDMGAGGHFLEEYFDWLSAFFALEGQDAGWFGHGIGVGVKNAHFIIGRFASTEGAH
jgi:hypothetical protein